MTDFAYFSSCFDMEPPSWLERLYLNIEFATGSGHGDLVSVSNGKNMLDFHPLALSNSGMAWSLEISKRFDLKVGVVIIGKMIQAEYPDALVAGTVDSSGTLLIYDPQDEEFINTGVSSDDLLRKLLYD